MSFCVCRRCNNISNAHLVEASRRYKIPHPCWSCGADLAAYTTEGASQTELGDEQADDARVGAAGKTAGAQPRDKC